LPDCKLFCKLLCTCMLGSLGSPCDIRKDSFMEFIRVRSICTFGIESTRAGEFRLGARLRREGGRKFNPSREWGSGSVFGISFVTCHSTLLKDKRRKKI